MKTQEILILIYSIVEIAFVWLFNHIFALVAWFVFGVTITGVLTNVQQICGIGVSILIGTLTYFKIKKILSKTDTK
jgi:hypothetical protein